MNDWNYIWQRLEAGEHAVSLGAKGKLTPAGGLMPVVVDCGFVSGPGACVEEARRSIEAAAPAAPHTRLASQWAHLKNGARRHLLGDPAYREKLNLLRESFGRVSGNKPTIVLILRAVDQADALSLNLLMALLDAPLGLALPTLFCFDDTHPKAQAKSLLDLLRQKLPENAFIESPQEPLPLGNVAAESWLENLAPETLSVLRAAAVMGVRFESEVIAQLLDQSEAQVLVHLQRAADAGLALEDRGDGRFRMSAELTEVLRRQTLPSLTRAWHRRLADVFGGGPDPERQPFSPAIAALLAEEAQAARPPPEARPSASKAVHEAFVQPKTATPSPEQLFEAVRGASSDPDEPEWQRALLSLDNFSKFETHSAPARPARAERDAARAAEHAEAAGDATTAAANYLRAAERAATGGDHDMALQFAGRAQQLLATIPPHNKPVALELTALLGIARSRWLGASRSGHDTLGAALQILESNRARFYDSDASGLLAQFAALIASICYDIGTPEALEGALEHLTSASKRLLTLNQPLLAAELLNDEAAVWVKIGDPVRAHHLLSRSREVFSRVVRSYPNAAHELSETEHLLARLVLHAPARSGRERDAWQLGIEHALSAIDGYQGLGDEQQAARVWETLGRLEARLGHMQRAADYLEQATSTQSRLGDVVGLARSTAAMAQVQAQLGNHAQALRELSESIDLNMHKGSVAGLEYNREALEQLRSTLPGSLQKQANALLAQLGQLLQD